MPSSSRPKEERSDYRPTDWRALFEWKFVTQVRAFQLKNNSASLRPFTGWGRRTKKRKALALALQSLDGSLNCTAELLALRVGQVQEVVSSLLYRWPRPL